MFIIFKIKTSQDPNVFRSRMLVIGVLLLVFSSFTFLYIIKENTFGSQPGGMFGIILQRVPSPQNGETYTIQKQMDYGYSSYNLTDYNASSDITIVKLYGGPFSAHEHKVKGNVTGQFKPKEFVLLRTKWDSSLDYSDQIWSIEKYNPPFLQLAITSYFVVLGLILILTTVHLFGKVNPKNGPMKIGITTSLSLFYFAGYAIGSSIYDTFTTGMCSLFLSLILTPFIFFLPYVLKTFETKECKGGLEAIVVCIALPLFSWGVFLAALITSKFVYYWVA